MYNLAITLYVREREEGRVTYILAMTLSVGERESCVHLGHGTLCKRGRKGELCTAWARKAGDTGKPFGD